MSERTIYETFALIRPDGKIAGNGEGEETSEDREYLDSLLDGKNLGNSTNYLNYLKRLNNCDTFRVGKVRMVEVIEDE